MAALVYQKYMSKKKYHDMIKNCNIIAIIIPVIFMYIMGTTAA